ncbi:hypothetical protein CHS0354_023837 [Potamilus streckersoni]|uniref:glutamate-5-semialdehyde dehydrogenase n=1 Tax=Potamilus streckersoni TaxID=2493646 RepID=A0AAE0RZ33_9BIVA|nr:hypothetical protein CHS0354_023837 [Potamilus streckersoni]
MDKDIESIFRSAKTAARDLVSYSDAQREDFIYSIANELEKNIPLIVETNKRDSELLNDDDPKKDRLILNEERIRSIINACRNVAQLPSPIGQVAIQKNLKNGLFLQKVLVPFGVVCVIFESRPNVTIDISVLCLKAGCSTILRGGKEAVHSNRLLTSLIQNGIRQCHGNPLAVQFLPTDRTYLSQLLSADKFIDLIIPRGSQELISFVRKHSTIPSIETGAGVCHTYIHKEADLSKAARIVDNAKHQRPSVCNALDTMLLDEEIALPFLKKIAPLFSNHKTGIWADDKAYSILKSLNYPNLHPATEDSFGMEYLSLNCSVKVVSNLEEALSHIESYSSKHSEAVISENKEICLRFINEVDAAAVFTNASTRFTDGEVFELGAEIGISTQKLHARGPFAIEKLVTEKWIIQVKANFNLDIIRTLLRLGAGMDVNSAGELFRVIKAGALPKNVIMSGVGKTHEDINAAVEAGIKLIKIESLSELHYLETISSLKQKRIDIGIRVTPGVDAKTNRHITTGSRTVKFGIEPELVISEIIPFLQRSKWLSCTSVDMHIGSNIFNTQSYADSINIILKLCHTLRKSYHINIQSIDVGGGFSVTYNENSIEVPIETYAQEIVPLLKDEDAEIFFEPGRYIVGNSALIATTVLYTKSTLNQKKFIVIDASMTELIRPLLYDAHHDIIPATLFHEKNVIADIVGPVCETGDFLALNRSIANVLEGTILAIMSAGAYGSVMSSNYNGRPRIAEILVSGSKVTCIRKLGIGLIGGSIGLKLMEKHTIYGYDTNENHKKIAIEKKMVHFVHDFQELIQKCHFIIVSVPVHNAPHLVKEILDKASNILAVIDVGSTKQGICDFLKNHPNRNKFVATHPMAGTENSGPEAACKNLFREKKVAFCDIEYSSNEALSLANSIYDFLGMNIIYTQAKHHDEQIAFTSHLCHITSFAYALTALEKAKTDKKLFDLTSSGFFSASRLAVSAASTWVPILIENKDAVTDALKMYKAYIDDFLKKIEAGNRTELQKLIDQANLIKNIKNTGT